MANGIWTNNWQALMNVALMGANYAGFSTLVNMSGTAVANRVGADDFTTAYSPMVTYGNNASASGANPCRIVFGTSGTTPAASDYNVGGPITGGISYLSVSNVSYTPDISNGTLTRVIRQTVQNTGSEALTLREWGVVARYVTGFNLNNANATGEDIFIYHELLESPMSLTPLQSATLELSLTMTLSSPL